MFCLSLSRVSDRWGLHFRVCSIGLFGPGKLSEEQLKYLRKQILLEHRSTRKDKLLLRPVPCICVFSKCLFLSFRFPLRGPPPSEGPPPQRGPPSFSLPHSTPLKLMHVGVLQENHEWITKTLTHTTFRFYFTTSLQIPQISLPNSTLLTVGFMYPRHPTNRHSIWFTVLGKCQNTHAQLFRLALGLKITNHDENR